MHNPDRADPFGAAERSALSLLGKVSERGMVFVGLFGGAEQTDKHIPFGRDCGLPERSRNGEPCLTPEF
jgi:hypothetical protein